MRNRLVVIAASALSLAACGSEPDAAGDISKEEVAERAEEAVKLEPGQYRTTLEFVSIDVPGAPEGAVAAIERSMKERSSVSEFCLTPEEAAKGGFQQVAMNSNDADCRTERFDVDGGEIDAEMSCTGVDGSVARMTLRGTGTRTSSDMTMIVEGQQMGVAKGTITMRARNQRIGDCPA